MNEQIYIHQIEKILDDFKVLVSRTPEQQYWDLPANDSHEIVSRIASVVERTTGRHSTYTREVERILHHPTNSSHVLPLVGIAQGLLEDLKNGHMKSLVELLHADVFADFLEMAQHLLDCSFKDAAAVIAGSSLEAHLRALSAKSSIPTVTKKSDGSPVAKKAEALNMELTAAGIYEKLDQKSVTAWLDLRNKAAHGKYSEYQENQVSLLISGIRDFISRKPA